jgi:glycine/D-amino acid oxidase-like deaminating enzyme
MMSEPQGLWTATAPIIDVPVDQTLPSEVDVAVIGGGYTGLAAARAAARGGARVAVLERSVIGDGASSRNGGMVLPGFKADLGRVIRRHGRATARALFQESLDAIRFVGQLVADERIGCDWRPSGHLTLAAKPAHLTSLRTEQQLLAREFGHQTTLLGATEIRSEIGSNCYAGGLLDPAAAALQPAALVRGLALATCRAGATLLEQVEVQAIEGDSGALRLETNRGSVRARQVVVATNGYHGRLVPWLASRIVPVGSFIIATGPLAAGLRTRLIPHNRTLSDTWNLLHYFRFSPDGRMVFGGRAGLTPGAVRRSAGLLRRAMVRVFPELSDTPVEYTWGGTLGFTLDQLPHVGVRHGIAYALGYCGHGVALSTWLGDRLGRALLGAGPWPALAGIPYPAIPFYRGRPWFLPLAGAYYGIRDRFS